MSVGDVAGGAAGTFAADAGVAVGVVGIGVAAQLLLLLVAAVEGVGILHTVILIFRDVLRVACLQVFGVGLPRVVVEEVLQALLGHDDAELCGVAESEDAVAAQDEVLGTQGTRAVSLGVQAQVEGCQRRTAGKGRVGYAEAKELNICTAEAAPEVVIIGNTLGIWTDVPTVFKNPDLIICVIVAVADILPSNSVCAPANVTPV